MYTSDGCNDIPNKYTMDALTNYGYHAKILNLQTLQGTPYNPFAYIRSDDDIIRIAEILADSITNLYAEMFSESMADRILTSILSALIAYLHRYGQKNEQNMGMVVKMMHASIPDETYDESCHLDGLFDEIKEQMSESVEQRMKQQNDKTLAKSEESKNKGAYFAYLQYKNFKLAPFQMRTQALAIAAEGLMAFNTYSMQALTNRDEMQMDSLDLSAAGFSPFKQAILLIPSDCKHFNILNEVLKYQAKENGMVIFN